MSNKEDRQTNRSTSPPPLEDRLNATIGVLTRREVEARILAPMAEALGEAFGFEEVLTVMRDTIVKIAQTQGAELRELMRGNSLKHFAASLKYWTQDNALEFEVLEQNERVFAFNVTRCRYAELYQTLGVAELGSTFSCARDFALIRGFNRNIALTRTQTIMEGAAHCDFRYRFIENS
ncbi:MAG: L-2-amino-thiazoline-4-carboxylic acid hydrolase [Desulfobacterales bacterium]|nr:MAG: L-2-amino-thiazoline-4-carboxylic acid hydrolase [Desulfobacterales bacterium]